MTGRIWDFWAAHYDSLWVQRFSLGPTRRAILGNVPDRPGMAFLDMGCGTGQVFGDLKEHFGDTPFRYTGVDRSERMVEVARAKYPDGRFTVASCAGFVGGAEAWDVIICSHAFPYFSDKPGMMAKLHRMLKAGGILLLAQASVNNPYDALILSLVRLSASRAQYPSRRGMRGMAAPVFGMAPQETRINPNRLVPSIYLFKWTKNSGTAS